MEARVRIALVCVTLCSIPTASSIAEDRAPQRPAVEKASALLDFTLTPEEQKLLNGHADAFVWREIKFKKDDGTTEIIRAGSLIALWRDHDTIVQGGDKVTVRWMIPQQSRRQLLDLIGKSDRVVFEARTVAPNGQIFTMYVADAKQFAEATGSFEASTPGKSFVRGAGTMYLYLGGKTEGHLASNILGIKVLYDH